MDVEVDDLERKYSAMITFLLRPSQNAAPFYDLSHTRAWSGNACAYEEGVANIRQQLVSPDITVTTIVQFSNGRRGEEETSV